MAHQTSKDKTYFFDNPRNVKMVIGCCLVVLVVLLLAEFVIHKHGHFPWEAWPEFFAVFGFVAFVFVVVVAKYILRPIVERREDYYD